MVNPLFSGMHDIAARDKTRDWNESGVTSSYRFDAKDQPLTSYQNPWELARLLEIYEAQEPKSYLELGPYHGGTLYWFLRNAITGCKLAAVDFFDELLGPREATPALWNTWVKKDCEFKFFEGNTHDPTIVAAVRDYFTEGLDWLFIDANHEYEHCRADLDNYGPMVNPGGVIVLHDVRPRDLGSYRLWEELRHAGHVCQLLVADPYSKEVDAGIGVIYL